ncbi:serine/threonine-protein kinase [Terriglobus roseus]|uniref:Serine/threonine protein kinase n=1 Tax=Terriglobus roseus TaxID=392734 RepID=A0A1G7KMZ7_9BACT|nr:serine/threonine-protein kinase [Terriglobus roseus]SDF38602.1 serine/threonine protein kinase [Terriglobus roseus]
MDKVRWDRLQTVFLTAVDLQAAERRDYLLHACGNDFELFEQAVSMLSSDGNQDALLNTDIQQVVAEIFDASSDLNNSLLIGPYQLKEYLGEGGMGVVWLAERTDAGNEVAMKFLLHAALSPVRRERFASEVRNLAKLNHPYIAHMYDAGTLSDGTPWLVMEYVRGISFTSYCRQDARTPLELIELFRRICEAVLHAHQQLIVHRDLKPSNILVQPDGTPKLLDFGISRELQSVNDDGQATAPQLRFMSLRYAAPEWKEQGIVAASNDIYSLGVIFYEMLTGVSFPESAGTAEGTTITHPSSIVSVLKKNSTPYPSAVAGFGRDAWADLDLLCLKAVHADPSQRYPSVEALIRDIDHYTYAEPLEARPEGALYRAKKFIRRNRNAVLAAGAALILIVGSTAFFTWRLARARTAALVQAERAQQIQRFIFNLFEGDDKEAGPGQDLKVVTLLDRGSPAAHTLSTEPAVQAELYYTLGTMYMKLGKLDRAEAMLQSALSLQQSETDDVALAETLMVQGLLRSERGKPDEAEQLVRRALNLVSGKSPLQAAAQARALTALGQVLVNRGKYTLAVEALEQAAALEAPQQSASELSNTLSNLSTAHLYLGHYTQAAAITNRLLKLDSGWYPANHPRIAEDLQNLSQVEEMWGRYGDAEGHGRQALHIDQTWYGEDNPKTAVVETSLASTLIYENNYLEAETLLKKALHTQETVYGDTSPHVAFVLNSLAGVEGYKKHFQVAEDDYRRTADIYRLAYGANDYRVAIAVSNLAGVLLHENRYAEPEHLFEEVIHNYEKSLSADNINIGIAQIKLGRVFIAEHRYRDAEPHTLAGYTIVSRQQSPSSGFVKGARHDLALIYSETGQPEKGRSFRD